MEFDYLGKRDPIKVTQTFSSNLLDLPPEKIMSRTIFLEEFNEPIIKKYLDMMNLDNLNVYISSKSFEKECTLTEKYFGTKYCKEKLNITE